jgi:hypothetical protein
LSRTTVANTPNRDQIIEFRRSNFALRRWAARLAPLENPADVFLRGDIHLCRNHPDKLPGWHGNFGCFASRSVEVAKNCEEANDSTRTDCSVQKGK